MQSARPSAVYCPLPMSIRSVIAEYIAEFRELPGFEPSELPHIVLSDAAVLHDETLESALNGFDPIEVTFGEMAVFEDDGRLCLGVSLESAELYALQSEVGATGYRSRIPLAYSDNTDIYEFDGVPLTITGQDAVVDRVIVQNSDTRRQYTLLGASAGLDMQSVFGKAQKPAESDTGRLVAIAEILFGVYGEEALEMLGGGSEFMKAWDESKHVRDARGRFAPKNGPKDVEAIRGAIQEALRGKRTKRSVFDLVDRLGELTLPQLNDLKRKYGVSASGRTKRDLVKKIADRLDRGRREQPEDSGESAVELPTKKDVESFQYDYEKAVFENGDESWLYNRMKNRKPAKNWGLETVDDADMKKLVAYQLGAWGKNPDDYVLVEVPVSEVTPSQTGSDYDNESSRVQSESIGTWLGTGRAEDYAPILVNEDGVIIDGNHRHASRAIAGVEKIQVLTPKGGKLTDPKREHEVVGKPRYATVNDFNLDADDSRMQRIAQGDSEAFNDLVSEYQKPLERHILPKVRDVQLAEDITQETLLRVHNAAKDYKPDGKFKGWLYRVAGNIVRDKGRRTNARIKTVGGTDSEGNDMLSQAAGSGRESSSVASESELFRTVDRILQKLPPEQREAWQMANNDGLSTEEIAAATGVARNTAKSRVRLARERIADELAQVDESYRELVRKALFQDFDGLLLKSVTPVSRAVFDTMFAKFGANCGTGAGGFQPGNTCGSHEQSVTSDGTLRISAEQARQLLPKQPKKWKLSGDGFQHIRQAAKGMPEATTREVVQHLIDSEGEPLTSWAVSQSQTDKLMDRWYSNASKFMDESGDGIEYMEIDGESYEDWFIDNFAVDDEQVLSDIVSQYDERMAKRRSFEKSMFSKAFCRTGKGGGVDNSCGRESDSKHPVMPTKRKLKGLVSAYLQVTKDRRGAQKIINTYDAIVKRKLKREGYDTVEEFAFQQVLSTLRKRNPEIHRKVLRLFDPWFRGEVKLPKRSYALAKSMVDSILGADDARGSGAFWKSADNCGTGAGGFQPGNTCGKNKRSEWNDGKTGAELTIPEVGNRVQFDVRISDVQDQPGYIRIDSDYGKAYIPEESLSHFYSDMTGDMSILGETGDPAVDSVARGEGRMIGKGNDSVAFEIGDEIVKVSSTVPYHPVGGPPHRTVKQMMTEAKAAQSVFQELKEAGVPGLPETRFLDLGNKLVSVQPKLTVTEDLNEKQLKQLRDSVIAIHKQGYAIGDQLQFGIDSSGNVQHFDITSAYKPSDKIRMYDEEREVVSLFKKNGVQYYMSVEQALSDFGQAKEMIERRGKVKPHTKLMLQEAHAALSDASHEMEWDILDYMEANGVPTLWEESNTKIEKSMFSSIFGKSLNNVGDKSELVAEILLGVFGESVLSEAGFLKAWYTWNEADHPRDERGRFARKEDAIGEARSLIKTALQGRKTADSAKELASVLGTLSVKELHSLKREYNISASGLKRELIGKIADRLDSGRRKDYSTEPEKQDRFELEQPRKERKKAKFDAIPQGKQGEMFDLGRNDLEGQNLLFNTDAGAGDDPTTMESKVKLSKFKQAVQDAALENELEPDVLENAVEEIWDLNRSYHNQREDMKKEIRRVMQINAGDVSRIENGNLDLDSVRGFDEGLQELMTAYPDIAVANDPEQFVWGLLREGKIDPPAKHSKEIIDEAVQYVIGSKTQPVEYAGNFDTEDWFLRSMVSAWNSGHRGGMLLKSSMLGNGDTTTVAEILLSVYGPQVVGWFGSNMDVMKAWRTWDESQHPRDARGRFTNKDDNFDEVSAKIRAALKGRKTKESAVELAGMLMKLRVSDLHRIRKEFGLSASGLKRELVEKLARRLDSGRRDDYSAEPVKQSAPSKGTLRGAAEHYYDTVKHDEFAWARESEVQNVGEDLLGSARHKRNEWRTLEELETHGADIAAKAITRDNLLKQFPPELSSVADASPMTALAMHYAMKSLPKDPYGGKSYLSEEQKKIARGLYLDNFQKLKTLAEELAVSEANPSKAIHKFGAAAKAIYDEAWTKTPGVAESEVQGVQQRVGRQWYDVYKRNWTADGRRSVDDPMYRQDKTTDTITKMKVFAHEAKSISGDQWKTSDGISDKVIAIMEGKSLPEVFGKKGQGKSKNKFDYSTVYVTGVSRRVGPSRPETLDGSVESLRNVMGIRGLQYGNSMTDKERLHHTVKTAEALLDLADVMNINDAAVSINGKLGLAFGARGRAGTAATYEPDSAVINLTRKNGAGSLAHEWAHFMDHHGTSGPGFGSETSHDAEFNTLRISWETARARIRQYARETGENVKYWTSDVEMFARYSERYVQKRLQEMGRENTYLVGLIKETHPLWPSDAELEKSRPMLEAVYAKFRNKHGSGDNATDRSERMLKMLRGWNAAESLSTSKNRKAFDTLFGKCLSTKDGESGGYLAKCPCGGDDPKKCTCDEKPVVKCNGRKCGCGKKADFVRRAFDKVFSA